MKCWYVICEGVRGQSCRTNRTTKDNELKLEHSIEFWFYQNHNLLLCYFVGSSIGCSFCFLRVLARIKSGGPTLKCTLLREERWSNTEILSQEENDCGISWYHHRYYHKDGLKSHTTVTTDYSFVALHCFCIGICAICRLSTATCIRTYDGLIKKPTYTIKFGKSVCVPVKLFACCMTFLCYNLKVGLTQLSCRVHG